MEAEPINRKGGRPRIRVLIRTPKVAAVLLLALAGTMEAQQTSSRWVNDAGAGLYGTRHDDGPVLYARQLRPVGRFGLAGVREEYSENDRFGVISAGVEAAFALNIDATTLYVPVGLALGARVSRGLPFLPRLGGGGLDLWLSAGFGIGLPAGPAQVAFEVRPSIGFESTRWAGTFAVRTRPGREGMESGSARLYANALLPLTPGYRREPDYQGYTAVYQWPVSSRLFDAVRASFGVDFLEFRGYSTGVITRLIGTGIVLAQGMQRHFVLEAVPQIGAIFYPEGSERVQNPAAMMGLEATLGSPTAAVTAGLSGLGAITPEGALVGLQYRVGVAMGL
ncbi:MAG: hypothetical protein HY700_07395 [Gemmatimonadetes bacterium]|nr:hypothetical protein [Gemmatimonadota bacterium]